jgi:hypothetical protein
MNKKWICVKSKKNNGDKKNCNKENTNCKKESINTIKKIDQYKHALNNNEDKNNDDLNESVYSDNTNNDNQINKLNSESNDFENENENLKKILCHNIIYNGNCKYGNKCMYAHDLENQNINDNRKIVYDIIKGDNDLSLINLKENKDLYKSLIELTRYCKNCNKNLCIGGYNCKSGSYSIKYCICITDLNYGNCQNQNCSFIHLSKRGLKSYYNNIFIKKSDDNITLQSDDKCLDFNDILSLKYEKKSDDSDSELSIIDSSADESCELNISEDCIDYIKYICEKSIFE